MGDQGGNDLRHAAALEAGYKADPTMLADLGKPHE